MLFGDVVVLSVYVSLKTFITMVTIMKNYLRLDGIDDDADLRYDCRDTMIAQFKQDLYNKSLSH